jgi:hypothetical protein
MCLPGIDFQSPSTIGPLSYTDFMELYEAPRVIKLFVETAIGYVFCSTQTVKSKAKLKVNDTGMARDSSNTTAIDLVEFISVTDMFHLSG